MAKFSPTPACPSCSSWKITTSTAPAIMTPTTPWPTLTSITAPPSPPSSSNRWPERPARAKADANRPCLPVLVSGLRRFLYPGASLLLQPEPIFPPRPGGGGARRSGPGLVGEHQGSDADFFRRRGIHRSIPPRVAFLSLLPF